MRRLLLALFAFLIPLQLGWAAVSAYCAHENGEAAKHFGHHEHQHAPCAKADGDSPSKGGIDSDCGSCHAGTLTFVGDALPPLSFGPAAVDLPPHVTRIASPPTRPPYRPNWVRLA